MNSVEPSPQLPACTLYIGGKWGATSTDFEEPCKKSAQNMGISPGELSQTASKAGDDPSFVVIQITNKTSILRSTSIHSSEQVTRRFDAGPKTRRPAHGYADFLHHAPIFVEVVPKLPIGSLLQIEECYRTGVRLL